MDLEKTMKHLIFYLCTVFFSLWPGASGSL